MSLLLAVHVDDVGVGAKIHMGCWREINLDRIMSRGPRNERGLVRGEYISET